MIIREACIDDAVGIAKVHVDSWRTTYAGIVPDEFLANMSYDRREEQWFNELNNPTTNRMFTYVAENDLQQVIGFVNGGPERNSDPIYKGELYAIYILKHYQGQGIGYRLTKTLMERLLQAGMNSMLLWVLADNPARHFYEALGGQQVKKNQIEIGEVKLDEVAYGWLDISIILQD